MSVFDIYAPIGGTMIGNLLVVAILEGLAVYFWQFRKMAGAKAQVAAQTGKALWLLLLIGAKLQEDLAGKLLLISLQQITAISLAYVGFFFITQISGQDKTMPRWLHPVLGGILALVCLLIATNPWHGLYWTELRLEGETLVGVNGVWSHVAGYYVYLLFIINLAFGLRWVLTCVGSRRRQAFAISVLPMITIGAHFAANLPGEHFFAPTALGFLLSGLYSIVVYRWWLFFTILPEAQAAVVETMLDGLLVVDQEGYIVEMNPAAERIFAGLPAHKGGKISDVVAAWPALAALERMSVELVRDLPEGKRHYQAHQTPLKNATGHCLGRVILLQDITRHKEDQAKLVEQEKALSVLIERQRIGRELHDGQGQVWSYINMQVEAALSFLAKDESGKAAALLKKVAQATQDVHVNIRESITGLQTKGFSEKGFWQTLQEYFCWFEQNYRIKIVLQREKEMAAPQLAPTVEVQLLRIIQEALTNVRKHAAAKRVKVEIWQERASLFIALSDDGCGFDVAQAEKKKSSYGLKIMQERAEEAGILFRLDAKTGYGTKVTLQAPLSENERETADPPESQTGSE
ncbi:histidine kinase N-terminal 7TM domain-containing protein [Azotosporobacter soli]|uniref:sensor histidine kinase n=1 Tax=Azotosporobacter soli TaxID=3055040 RepID=UPI0031FF3A32